MSLLRTNDSNDRKSLRWIGLLMVCSTLLAVEAMAKVTMYEISDDTLEFRSDNESIARFTAMYLEQR